MKVSVVILAYNMEPYLGEALDSVLAQQCAFDVEIVLGEDCSTDNTRQVCLAYQAKHPDRIRLLLQEQNQKLVENFYQTLTLCRGEYVALLDGDDCWCDPCKLQKQVDFLEKNPDYALVHGGMLARNVAEGGEKSMPVRDLSGWCYDPLLEGNFIYNSTVCFRRCLLERVDTREIRAQRFYSQDWPLWLALAREGKFHAMRDVVAVYRVVPGSISHPRSLDALVRLYESNRAVMLFYAQKYHAADVAFRRRINGKYNYEIVKLLIKAERQEEASALLAALPLADFWTWKMVKARAAYRFPVLRKLLFK